jgi:hypothetical protein
LLAVVPVRVEEACRVSLKVVDMLGNEAAVLTDTPYPAGDHTFHFDAGGLPSGICRVRINAGDFTASRKMVKVD